MGIGRSEVNHLPESFDSWLASEEVDLYCAPSPSSLAKSRCKDHVIIASPYAVENIILSKSEI